MTLFKVDIDKKIAEELQPTKFKTLDLWERKDIQEWVKDNPGLIEEDILILSSEFDQFDKTKERLDVLGIKKVTGSDGSSFGRLVVVELKRDSDKTHALQALQYAAFVSRFTVDDVVSEAALTTYVLEGQNLAQVMHDLMGAPGVDQVAPFGTTLHVVGRDKAALKTTVERFAKDGIAVRPGKTSLEDVFIQLMARPKEKETTS